MSAAVTPVQHACPGWCELAADHDVPLEDDRPRVHMATVYASNHCCVQVEQWGDDVAPTLALTVLRGAGRSAHIDDVSRTESIELAPELFMGLLGGLRRLEEIDEARSGVEAAVSPARALVEAARRLDPFLTLQDGDRS